MNKIRESMDEGLKELKVTRELRERTLDQFRLNHNRRFDVSYYFKAMTVFSSFIVLVVLSFNLLYPVSPNPQVEPMRINPEIESSFGNTKTFDFNSGDAFQGEDEPEEDEDDENIESE
jgi:hypothetical protein